MATIPGEPVAQGRPRAFKLPSGQLRAFDPAKSRTWKADARVFFLGAMKGKPPLQGAVSCLVVAVFTCPKSDFRKRDPQQERPHTKRPDAENVAKAVLDAATGIVWLDDSQVCDLTIEKRIAAQGCAPYVMVEVTPWA